MRLNAGHAVRCPYIDKKTMAQPIDITAEPLVRMQAPPTFFTGQLDGLGARVDRLKVNSVVRLERDGVAWWRKERNAVAPLLLSMANVFFRWSGAGIKVDHQPAQWLAREMTCFQLLHGAEGFAAFAEGRRLWVQELPGVSLDRPLESGKLTPEMTHAAGRELRRAHSLVHGFASRRWSHGDPHLANFVWEEKSRRARLIDFEVGHPLEAAEDDRHADDLAVFLLDMAGRVREDLWTPCALAFLEGYEQPAIAEAAVARCARPARFSTRVWWHVRTSFTPSAELTQRFSVLAACCYQVSSGF